MHYLLFYDVGEDYVSKRALLRNEHLEKAWKASERGELVLGGALADPVDGAVLLFKGDSPEVAERFARNDPYVTSGAVKRWHVREWTTVAGEEAVTPIRPNALPADKDEYRCGQVSTPVDERSPSRGGGILRMWKGRSTVEKSDDYIRHVITKVFPELGSIEGHRRAYLVRRALDHGIEFLVLTLWDSIDAIGKFAGTEPGKAVVEPAARAVLTEWDDTVTHFEVILDTGEPG